MPHYAVLIYAGDQRPWAVQLAEHDRHSQDLIASGALVAAFAFAPSGDTVTIGETGVTPGPVADAQLVVAGIGIIEADDHDAAIEIAKRNPATWQGGAVEVRPVEGAWVRGESASDAAPGVASGEAG